MPIANLKCVREVSSEDPNYSAENLLKQEPGKKWKTRDVGEKSAYAIFELDKPSRIIGIDIGNEHSAFVEVLVSNKGCRQEDFTEILITCSFMTPIESKNSSNTNRVRCFNQEALVPTVVSEKWHLVKIICTQPFNKHVQYGLSFIKLHIVDSESAKRDITPKALVPEKFLIRKPSTESKETQDTKADGLNRSKVFANFALREDSPDSESESSSALFNRWKMSRVGDKLPTAAAAIRQASTTAGLKKLSDNIKPVLGNKSPVVERRTSTQSNESNDSEVRDRNRNDLTFGKDDEMDKDKKLQRLSKHIEEEKKRLELEKELSQKKEKKEKKIEKNKKEEKAEKMEKPAKLNRSHHNESKNEKDPSLNISQSKKRHSSPSMRPAKKMKPSVTTEFRPFNELLRGVVLVISGIQNPDRADLRSKAVAMGAKYKADWDHTCTHLICAFKNTPKYNQVKGKGKIVTRFWIEKCFDLKKYLPWRRYALDSREQSQPESDNEILDISMKPANKEEDIEMVESPRGERTPSSSFSKSKRGSVDSYEGKSFIVDSGGSDTDDEIQRVLQKNNKENKKPSEERNVFDITTEEEDYVQSKTAQQKKSPRFFSNLKFYLADHITNSIKEQLKRCIQQYGGIIVSDLDKANYIVGDKVDENVKSSNVDIVKPHWIFECNDMETKVKLQQYLINKNH